MAKKKDTIIPMPNDIGNDFEDSDDILNYRPKIEYIEPDPDYFEDSFIPLEEKPETIDNLRDRTKNLVDGFNTVAKLADIAQKRVDERVKASGGLDIKLDPNNPRDYHTIAAMKRRFPDKEDPTTITYDDYKKALDCIQKNSPEAPRMTSNDIKTAKSDPYKTDFGGYSNQQGENRTEVSSAGMPKPLDLDAFQKAAVLGLFALMLPLIKGQDEETVIRHLLTSKHF